MSDREFRAVKLYSTPNPAFAGGGGTLMAGTGACQLGGSAVAVLGAGPRHGMETVEGGRGIGSSGERNVMRYGVPDVPCGLEPISAWACGACGFL